MQPPKKLNAEYLGPVKINNGQLSAELRRERDPTGSTVVHPVRKSPYLHERWHSAGKLDPDLFAAAEKVPQGLRARRPDRQLRPPGSL
jgi:hypothetical protein